jgi:hypothetical protein
MSQLSREEFSNLRPQIVTSSWGGPRRTTPYAFTEQRVAMLSSALNTERAIRVNITVMSEEGPGCWRRRRAATGAGSENVNKVATSPQLESGVNSPARLEAEFW